MVSLDLVSRLALLSVRLLLFLDVAMLSWACRLPLKPRDTIKIGYVSRIRHTESHLRALASNLPRKTTAPRVKPRKSRLKARSTLNSAINVDGKYMVCQIFGVQTAIVDNNLYISGGSTWYTSTERSDRPSIGVNRRTFWLDISKPFTTSSYTLGSSEMPSGPRGIPSLSNAAFFSNKNEIIQFHGSLPPQNLTDPNSLLNAGMKESIYQSQPQLLVFSPSTKSWSKAPLEGDGIVHAELGSSVSVPEKELGFWIGGITYANPGSLKNTPLDEMMRFNTTSGEWRVEKTGFEPRIKGNTVYLPVGDMGILINFAGQQYLGSDIKEWTNVAFDNVKIYDIRNKKWYTQRTTGDHGASGTGNPGIDVSGTPRGRQWPCSIAVQAGEPSSFHIYMFGGVENDTASEKSGFEEVWVLAIPEFRWKLVNSKIFGRWQAKCHLGGQSQVILVGGETDVDREKCTPQLLTIFDLNKLEWVDTYNPNNEAYKPSSVLSVDHDLIAGPAWPAPLDEEVAKLFSQSTTSIATQTKKLRPSTSSPVSPIGRLSSSITESLTVRIQTTTSKASPTALNDNLTSQALKKTASVSWGSIAEGNPTIKLSIPTNFIAINSTRNYISYDDDLGISKPNRTSSIMKSTTIGNSAPTLSQESFTLINPNYTGQMRGNSPPKFTSRPSGSVSLYFSPIASSTFSISNTPSSNSTATPTNIAESNLKPYDNTVGVITGSVLGGSAVIGCVATVLIVFWLRARRRRQAQRTSISKALLSTVPQAWVVHPPADNLAPPRRSRLGWNHRFSRNRGMVSMYELE